MATIIEDGHYKLTYSDLFYVCTLKKFYINILIDDLFIKNWHEEKILTQDLFQTIELKDCGAVLENTYDGKGKISSTVIDIQFD